MRERGCGVRRRAARAASPCAERVATPERGGTGRERGGTETETAALAAFISRHLPAILAPNGLVVADQPMPTEALAELPPPVGINPGRYFFYRLR
jgi:hypothetical protein